MKMPWQCLGISFFCSSRFQIADIIHHDQENMITPNQITIYFQKIIIIFIQISLKYLHISFLCCIFVLTKRNNIKQ